MKATRILLVDDEVSFVKGLGRTLTRQGLSVISAGNGREALDCLSSEQGRKVDVVILDVKMPGMNGLEALVAIKRLDPLLEIILLTGHATVESAIEGIKLGAFDYLLKPCDLETLLAKIKEAADKKRRQEIKIIEALARNRVKDN
ncbi:MAG: response regulator [Thermodesulfobacteriota bacterium]